MSGLPNTDNAHAGLFRRLGPEEAAAFRRQGSEDYRRGIDLKNEFVLSAMHHPAYRQGALLAALEHAAAELAVIEQTRSIAADEPEG